MSALKGVTNNDDDSFAVSLSVLQWAEVCAALQTYVRSEAVGAPVSQRDAIRALQEIHRVASGAVELPPPDDVLGVHGG